MSLISFLQFYGGVGLAMYLCVWFYSIFSSGEGFQFLFTPEGKCGRRFYTAIAAVVLFVAMAPTYSTAFSLTIFTLWCFYMMLVIVHYAQFGLWRRHIIPVTVPLVVIVAAELCRQRRVGGSEGFSTAA